MNQGSPNFTNSEKNQRSKYIETIVKNYHHLISTEDRSANEAWSNKSYMASSFYFGSIIGNGFLYYGLSKGKITKQIAFAGLAVNIGAFIWYLSVNKGISTFYSDLDNKYFSHLNTY